jgi:hypothetical protein
LLLSHGGVARLLLLSHGGVARLFLPSHGGVARLLLLSHGGVACLLLLPQGGVARLLLLQQGAGALCCCPQTAVVTAHCSAGTHHWCAGRATSINVKGFNIVTVRRPTCPALLVSPSAAVRVARLRAV